MISKDDRILVLGSCFAANMGERLSAEGYDVCINPFGTLFNPVSIHNSLLRLRSGKPFTEDECVLMGSGAGKWCSFNHYTLFAKEKKEDFLRGANDALEAASAFYRDCDKLIITFGTAFCFRHLGKNMVVSNCLKLPAREFERFRLGVDEIVSLYADLPADKDIIFTVSPVRHLADGAHGNQLSKSTLLLAEEKIVAADPARRSYFPSYEIMLDELRDYSWYADDKVHPNAGAIEHITGKFLEQNT